MAMTAGFLLFSQDFVICVIKEIFTQGGLMLYKRYAFILFLSIFPLTNSLTCENDNDVSKTTNMRITASKQFVTDSSERKIYLGKYRHYKGNFYQVLGLCKHTETQEELIYYKALYGNHDCWVHPVKMFFEEIEYENRKQPRFVFIE